MSGTPYSKLPERNPETYRVHRREVFWQITVPFVIGLIIFIMLLVITPFAATNNLFRYSDISLIWLILITIPFVLIFLIVLGALTYATIWAIAKLPFYARQAQGLLVTIQITVHQVSDKIVEPFLVVNSYAASAKVLKRRLTPSPRRKKKAYPKSTPGEWRSNIPFK